MIDKILKYFELINCYDEKDPLKKQIYSHITSFSFFNDINPENVKKVEKLIFNQIEKNIIQEHFNFNEKNIFSENLEVNIANYIKFHAIIYKYEENINSFSVDEYGRVINDVATQYNLKIEKLPYLDILIERIFNLYIGLEFIKKTNVLMTHDIDKIYYLVDIKDLIKTTIGDLLKRKFFSLQRLTDYWNFKNAHSDLKWLFRKGNNHIYLFLHNYSYLNADYKFPDDLRVEIKELRELGASFGFHYSFDAADDKVIMESEFNHLNETLGDIKFIRGHYLRRTYVSDSFIIDKKLIDLTPYPSKGGFLYFTGLPFVLSTKSGLKNILPTHSMDVSFELDNNLTAEEKYDYFLRPFYNSIGTSFFVVNWHNTSRRWGTWLNSLFKYEEICRRLGI